jgi:hypothetical protein
MSLMEEFAIAAATRDDFVTLLASSFPFGEWQGANTVVYRAQTGEVAVTLTYRKKSPHDLVDVQAGPGLSDEAREKLRGDAAALAAGHETVVWRDVFFSILPVDGYWRCRDEWQILPAPPQAPRPDFPLAGCNHAFIIELRVRTDPGRGLDAQIRERRLWELQLVLNLVLRGGIKRFSPRLSDRTWAVRDSDGVLSVEWLRPGYFIPDWDHQSVDFSQVASLRPLPEVSDDVYRTRHGIGSDDVFEIPAVLGRLLDATHAVPPETLDRFQHACSWYDRAGAAWDMSVSLGLIAAVSAIETIMPPGAEDRCPECRMNRAPGYTRRFYDFIERYAPLVPEADRKGIYELRSSLVHDGQLFDIDRPGPWAALIPRDLKQRMKHDAAQIVARDAIINWLLDHPVT